MLDCFACAEDAAAIRWERMMDVAQRLCHQGYPHLTERRRTRLWEEVQAFLAYCLQEGATGWETNDLQPYDLPCDLFRDHFIEFDVTDAEFQREKENRFFEMLRFIARTAFDAVDGFPGGTFGWTIGDLKRVYGGEISSWWSDGEWQDREGNPVDLNQIPDDQSLFI